jgi:hypothetical protein
MATQRKLITAEEHARKPEWERCELVEGEF